MTLDSELTEGIERAVAHQLGQAGGPGEQQLWARRLIHVAVRAASILCGPMVAAAEAFAAGKKVSETRLKP